MKRILLISADRNLQKELTEILSCYYMVRSIGTSDDLFEQVYDFNPDLLITDFILGDGNGGALCHQVKSNPATADIAVILLSEFRVMRRAFSKFGCDAILQKPLQWHELLDSVMSLLSESVISL